MLPSKSVPKVQASVVQWFRHITRREWAETQLFHFDLI